MDQDELERELAATKIQLEKVEREQRRRPYRNFVYTKAGIRVDMSHLRRVITAGTGSPSGSYTATHYAGPGSAMNPPLDDYNVQTPAAFTNSSETNPCTLACAMANATAGNKVQVAPGAYIGQSPGTAPWIAAFAPANSGTAANPIVFFARYPAAYNSGSPALLSEIRRTYTGTGRNSALGTRNGASDPGKHYVIFDGFYCDESLTLSGRNGGAFSMSGYSDHCEFRRIWFDRADVAPYGAGYNGSAAYFEQTTNCRLVDCLFTGTSTLCTNQDSAIEIYNSDDLTIEYNTFNNAGNCIHVKTESQLGTPTPMDDCVIRYNKMVGQGGLVTQTSRGTFAYQNLIIATKTLAEGGQGLKWTSTAEALDCQVQFYNNTVLRSGSVGAAAFGLNASLRIAAGTEIYNNIFRDTSGNSTNLVELPNNDGSTSAWPINSPEDIDRIDYNFYVDTAPRFRLYASGAATVHTTFAAYQSAFAAGYGLNAYGHEHESHSQHGTVTFVDEAGGNYRLASNGQAALTASVTGGPVGCYITGTEEIGLRANPTY